MVKTRRSSLRCQAACFEGRDPASTASANALPGPRRTLFYQLRCWFGIASPDVAVFVPSVFESELTDHIPVVKATIAGTRLVGRMTAGTDACSLELRHDAAAQQEVARKDRICRAPCVSFCSAHDSTAGPGAIKTGLVFVPNSCKIKIREKTALAFPLVLNTHALFLVQATGTEFCCPTRQRTKVC